MGLTGVLGRNVFSKSRSLCSAQEQQHQIGRGKKWSSVRSYLCGDELFDSVLAEEDSASVKTFVSDRSSEATVTQPMLTDEITTDHQTVRAVDEVGSTKDEEQKHKEEAAIKIQSAFRCYTARYRESESVCTSLEVQTANSVKIFTVAQKAKHQPLKLKEDWDDSTVSSNISKMRMQNRMEAMTRRERALAYAFSQQLRICSKKKSTRSDEETNTIRWSWLERWMATRVPEDNDFHTNKLHTRKPFSPSNNSFETSKEEKESCGSNEVFLQLSNTFSIKSPVSAHNTKQKRVPKPNRRVSKRKTVPSYQSCKDT